MLSSGLNRIYWSHFLDQHRRNNLEVANLRFNEMNRTVPSKSVVDEHKITDRFDLYSFGLLCRLPACKVDIKRLPDCLQPTPLHAPTGLGIIVHLPYQDVAIVLSNPLKEFTHRFFL